MIQDSSSPNAFQLLLNSTLVYFHIFLTLSYLFLSFSVGCILKVASKQLRMQVTHLKTTPKTTEGSLCQVPNEGWVITATRIGKEEVISSKMFKVNAVKSKWAPLVFPWSVYSPTILEAYHHLSLQTSDVNPSLHVLN